MSERKEVSGVLKYLLEGGVIMLGLIFYAIMFVVGIILVYITLVALNSI